LALSLLASHLQEAEVAGSEIEAVKAGHWEWVD